MGQRAESIWRAYDIRGVYPKEVNAEVFVALGRAFAEVTHARTIAVGRDVRLSGPQLQQAMIDGLVRAGVNVVDLGVIPTEMIYFAAGEFDYDGAVIVSASHNPAQYNGAKFIGPKAQPLDPDGDFARLKALAKANRFHDADSNGQVTKRDLTEAYLDKVLSLVDRTKLKPLKIVINPNFGAVCLTIKALAARLSPAIIGEIIGLNDQIDGSFPKGRPDPLRPETRPETIRLIQQTKPAFGAAWDADGDRVFFYDEDGQFIDGYYIVALLARYFLEKSPGSTVIYDQRAWWATDDLARESGGRASAAQVGHVFFKQALRSDRAPYGGELSGHHYFRDFYSCDSGLIPFLIIWQMVSEKGSLAELIRPLQEKYPISGELNFTVAEPLVTIGQLAKKYQQFSQDSFDGLTIFDAREWSVNIRASNNEPLLRLNVQATSQPLVEQKVQELTEAIQAIG